MRRREAVGHTDHQLDDLAPVVRAVHPVGERAARRELGDEELLAFELPDVVDREDVGVAQRGSGLSFALESPARGRVGQRVRQELDGDGPSEPAVERPEHDTHPAVTELRLDAVRPDVSARSGRHAVWMLDQSRQI